MADQRPSPPDTKLHDEAAVLKGAAAQFTSKADEVENAIMNAESHSWTVFQAGGRANDRVNQNWLDWYNTYKGLPSDLRSLADSLTKTANGFERQYNQAVSDYQDDLARYSQRHPDN